MVKKLKKSNICIKEKLMVLKQIGKRDVCMLSSIHHHEMKTVYDRKDTTK
jgi:hypothetical protein